MASAMRYEPHWMPQMQPRRAEARALLKVAIVIVVLVAAAAAGVYLLGGGENGDETDTASTQPAEIPRVRIKQDGDRITEVRFPMEARSNDDEANLFVSNFIDILLDENLDRAYKNYRLNVTQRRYPVSKDTFQRGSYRARLIEIQTMTPLEKISHIRLPELSDVLPPIYRVQVHVVLRDNRERTINLFIFRERGKWVASH